MEKRVEKKNTACVLYQSRKCAILNTRSCEECPLASGKDEVDSARVVSGYIDLFETLLPEGGVASLFESEECTICKNEPKGKRDCYAIVDFGHTEPTTLHIRKLFRTSNVGFMMPLQFACCKRCRNRFLLMYYMTLAVPTVLTALLIPWFVFPHWTQALRTAAPWLPLALAALTIGGGYLLGRLLKKRLKAYYSRSMYTDLSSHPTAVEMKTKGWFPLFGDRETQPVFSRKRIMEGIGNAPSDAYRQQSADIS